MLVPIPKKISPTKKIKPINEEPSLLVRVFNNYGVLVISTKNNGLSFNIPTVSLQDGNYIIELTYGEKVFRRHLIVKH